MKLDHGIRQMRVPIPRNTLGYTNVYLVPGTDGWLLIDAGPDYDESFDALQRQFAEEGIKFADVSRIVVTHTHHDHFGLVGRVKQLSGAEVTLHKVESRFGDPPLTLSGNGRNEVVDQLRRSGMPETELELVRVARPPVQGNSRQGPMPPDRTVEGGETISTGLFDLQVIWTPGHSPGHICLFEAQKRVLFSGDHILPVITPNVSQYDPRLRKNPLIVYLDSLKAMQGLDAALVLPAHEHIFTDLGRRIGELLHHHRRRLDAIMDVVGNGSRTIYEVAAGIRWIIRNEADLGIPFSALAPLDRGMAMGETTSHLELLRKEGKLERFFDQDKTYYRAPHN